MNLLSTHLRSPEQDQVRARLREAGITTVERVLATRDETLCSAASMTVAQARVFKQGLAERCGVLPVPLSHVLRQERTRPTFPFTTGSRSLDVLLGGTDTATRSMVPLASQGTTRPSYLDGFPCGQVTELAGQSASGKTQVCLSAAARLLERPATPHAPLPHVLYIDSSNSFHPERLLELLRIDSETAFNGCDEDASSSGADLECLRRFHCIKAFTAAEAIAVLSSLVVESEDGGSYAPSSSALRMDLLIVDALTPLVSPILGGARNTAGHQAMAEIGQLLWRIARGAHAAVVVTNSTVSIHEDDSKRRGGALGNVKAALGHTWSYVPGVQVLLSTTPVAQPQEEDGSSRASRKRGRSRSSTRPGLEYTARVVKSCAGKHGAVARFAVGVHGVCDV